VAAIAGTTNSEAADKWLRIRSKNFLLVGNASESSIRRVGRTLEEFRAGVALVFPAIAQQTSPPITVLVFKDDASFRPFKPLYQGKPANVAGYFQSGQDVDFIALTADTETPRVIYHEFVHSLTKDTTTALPLWANEGIAEVYSTELMLANNETLAARVMVSSLKNVTDDDAVQRRAQGLLDQIQKRMQTETAVKEYNDRQRAAEEARTQAPAAIRASAPSKEPDGPPKIRYNQTSPRASDSSTEATSKPIVRPAGKELEGSLVSIDCSQGMTLRVRIANSVNVELHSDDPSKIEFVSYSAAVSGSLTCGQFKTDTPVLIVYREATNPRYLGEPLRVEFTHIK
jgi:hypothetical protein